MPKKAPASASTVQTVRVRRTYFDSDPNPEGITYCPACRKKNLMHHLRYLFINLDEAIYKCESAKCMYPFSQFVYKNYTNNKIYKYEQVDVPVADIPPKVQLATDESPPNKGEEAVVSATNSSAVNEFEFPDFEDLTFDDNSVDSLKNQLESLLFSSEESELNDSKNSTNASIISSPTTDIKSEVLSMNDLIANSSFSFDFDELAANENTSAPNLQSMPTLADAFEIDSYLLDISWPSKGSQLDKEESYSSDLSELENLLHDISVESAESEETKKLLLNNNIYNDKNVDNKVISDLASDPATEVNSLQDISTTENAVQTATYCAPIVNPIPNSTPIKPSKKSAAEVHKKIGKVKEEASVSSPKHNSPEFVFKVPSPIKQLRISPTKNTRSSSHQSKSTILKKLDNANTSKVKKTKTKLFSQHTIKTEVELNKTVLKLYEKKKELKPFQVLKQLSNMNLHAVSKSLLQKITSSAVPKVKPKMVQR